MKDIELIKIIAQKTGREYEETTEIISEKIGFSVDGNNNVIQICMNNCNLMNETIPMELWQLHYLKRLYLAMNMISRFPEDLLQLHNLVHLDLSGNQLRIITGKISKLELLESLDLSGNQLETLPLGIGKISSLKKIRLNTNRLILLPSLNPKKDWLQLESIDLDGADIKELPLWLFSLQSLKCLSLSKLHLNRFPEAIYNLSKLERLYIDSTQFLLWPDKILLPKRMRFIVLDGTYLPKFLPSSISRIPDAIIELKPKYVRNQREIDRSNPIFQVSLGGDISLGLDESQLFHNDPCVSYNYLKNLYNVNKIEDKYLEYVRLKDIKIVLLGSGAVGKSSLVQRLCLSNPDDDNIVLESVQTTHGVNIDYQMNLHNVWDETNGSYEDFTAHFWDFGGQDKYRGINKLLLTDKAIYIIVLDSRTQSLPDIWLEMVKMYAPNSKIILVANKIDENQRLNINFKYYCEKYPQLYNCLFKISCKYPVSGINKISDISYAIKRIVKEQMNHIAPFVRMEWLKIQSEVEKQYRVNGKALLSLLEYKNICVSFGLLDESIQLQFLSILSICGSCISIEDEEFSVLNPNWLADYLYLFYNNSEQSKAIMDYKKEYIPMLKKLEDYLEYKELMTDYLESRGLCTTFFDNTHSKKIFIPMFLPETHPNIDKFPKGKSTLKYKWSSTIIPEYEFQKFLVIEFSKINKGIWSAWQYGIYIEFCDLKVCLQLIPDGILLEIWSNEIIECGKCLQWIRNSILSTAPKGFFNEYIFVQIENRSALLPYSTLERLNSWDLSFYCLPEQNDCSNLIPIDIKRLSQICGLKGKALEDEITDKDMLIKKKIEHGGVAIMKIENMYGNINKNETHGDNSPIVISESNIDSELFKAISDLKNEISLVGNDFNDLKILLNELEESTLEKRPSIKKRIANWMSQSANIITIGSALYGNKEAILEGVQHILNMI